LAFGKGKTKSKNIPRIVQINADWTTSKSQEPRAKDLSPINIGRAATLGDEERVARSACISSQEIVVLP
jgi:hypothetical protein